VSFLRFIVRRLLLGVFVLWLVTLAAFVLFFVAPPDVARMLAGKQGTAQQIAAIRTRLGLDQPITVQYWHYLDRLVHGNLGSSFYTGQPVSAMLKADLPPTLSVMTGGVVLWMLGGLTVGVISATRARSLLDRFSTIGMLVAYSMPAFVTGGLLLLVFFGEFSKIGVRFFAPGYDPISQGIGPWAGHMILPWITVASVSMASYGRLTRGSLLDALGEDYIRTARAKGLSERRVVLRHALRSAMTPVVTQLGVDLGYLVGNTILTETVFGLQGIGQTVAHAIVVGDLFYVLAVVMLTAVTVVIANIVVDIGYSVLDPRVRLT
jgi:peptide/nickel transport system permease protein